MRTRNELERIGDDLGELGRMVSHARTRIRVAVEFIRKAQESCDLEEADRLMGKAAYYCERGIEDLDRAVGPDEQD